jgi:hypothetical protein
MVTGQLVAPAQLKEARHWKKSIVINGVGAIATSIVFVVLVITKFLHGAWIVVVLIPLLTRHRGAAGVCPGEVVASSSAQPNLVHVEGRTTLQAQRDRDQRALSPED